MRGRKLPAMSRADQHEFDKKTWGHSDEPRLQDVVGKK
jgi:hypothetical protein